MTFRGDDIPIVAGSALKVLECAVAKRLQMVWQDLKTEVVDYLTHPNVTQINPS